MNDFKSKLVSKSQIDKAGKTMIELPNDLKANEVVKCYRLSRLSNVRDCIEMVVSSVVPEQSLFSARLKSLARIRRKIDNSRLRNNTIKLSRMDDIIGFRIICVSCSEAIHFSNRLEEKHSSQVKNYFDFPQNTGYRAIHHIFKVSNILPNEPDKQFTFEVQIRTVYQHQWALWSESFGERAKENRLLKEEKEHLLRLSHVIQKWEKENIDTIQDETLPIVSQDYNIVIVKKSQVGKPTQLIYTEKEWSQAFNMLVNWETPRGNTDTILLIADANSQVENTLKKTHSNYFEVVKVPICIRPNHKLGFKYK